MSERLKKPFKCVIFDDGTQNRSLDSLDALIDDFLKRAKKGQDVSTHEGNLIKVIENSEINRLINRKILTVSVIDQFIGYDSASVVIDNKDSDFTNKLFDGAIARTITDPDVLEAFRKRVGGDKMALTEGLQISIYGGYYSGDNDFSQVKRMFQGMISSMNFSYPESGTPTITLTLMDRLSWMNIPRSVQGSSLNMYAATISEENHPDNTAIKNDLAYMSNQSSTGLAYALGTRIPKKPNAELTSAGRSVGENLTTDTAKSTAQTQRTRTKKQPALKQYAGDPAAKEDVGLRDSQVVALVIEEYNRAIQLTYENSFTEFVDNFEGDVTTVFDEKKKFFQAQADRLKIKDCFIAMTGEGGPTYSDSSCFSPRVRGNKNVQPIDVTFYEYLQQLAAKHNFDLFVVDQTLFFIPPIIKTIPDFVFLYGSDSRKYADKNPDIYNMISFVPQVSVVNAGVDFWYLDYAEYSGMARLIKTTNVLNSDGTVDPNSAKRVLAYTVGSDKTKFIVYKDQKELADKTRGAANLITHVRFPSAAEDVATALAQAEADIIEAEISIEGNPNFCAGSTVRCAGMNGKTSEQYGCNRFDSNYRINEITHEWSMRGYLCSIKAVSRASQGFTFVANDAGITESEFIQKQKTSWDGFVGLWKKHFLLEPSLIHKSSAHLNELSSIIDTSDTSVNIQAERTALENGVSPELKDDGSAGEIPTLGLHTFKADEERFLKLKVRMLTFAEAAQLLYGNMLPISGMAMDTNRTSETRIT